MIKRDMFKARLVNVKYDAGETESYTACFRLVESLRA